MLFNDLSMRESFSETSRLDKSNFRNIMASCNLHFLIVNSSYNISIHIVNLKAVLCKQKLKKCYHEKKIVIQCRTVICLLQSAKNNIRFDQNY